MYIKYLQMIKSTKSPDFSPLVKVTRPDVGPRDTGRREVGRLGAYPAVSQQMERAPSLHAMYVLVLLY